MSDDYERAARKIVTDFGQSRARQLLEILEQGHIRNVIGPMSMPLDRDEELALFHTMQLVSAASDALDAIAWKDGTYADIDDAGRARMNRRLREALGRELGTT